MRSDHSASMSCCPTSPEGDVRFLDGFRTSKNSAITHKASVNESPFSVFAEKAGTECSCGTFCDGNIPVNLLNQNGELNESSDVWV
jgi:hypothetical protein